MSDIAQTLFSLGDWKAKTGKCERPRRSTRKSADAKMGPRPGVNPEVLVGSLQFLPYQPLLPRESNTPTRRHVYFPSGSSGAVFGSVTAVRAAFMIMARNV